MIVSCWSSMLFGLTPEETVENYLELGFEGFELSREHLEDLVDRGNPTKTARDFGSFIRDKGFLVPQAHLPMLDLVLSENRKKYVDEERRRIELLLEVGGVTHIVLHLGKGLVPPPEDMSYDELLERRIQAVESLIDSVNGTDSYICIENLVKNCRTSKEMMDIIHGVASKNLAICYDTGHQHQNHRIESASHFIEGCGDYIKAIHFNDNDGIYEQHFAPYSLGLNLPEHGAERLDVDEVLFGLKNIGFDGLFDFELPGENKCPLEVAKMKMRYYKELGNYMVRRMQNMDI